MTMKMVMHLFRRMVTVFIHPSRGIKPLWMFPRVECGWCSAPTGALLYRFLQPELPFEGLCNECFRRYYPNHIRRSRSGVRTGNLTETMIKCPGCGLESAGETCQVWWCRGRREIREDLSPEDCRKILQDAVRRIVHAGWGVGIMHEQECEDWQCSGFGEQRVRIDVETDVLAEHFLVYPLEEDRWKLLLRAKIQRPDTDDGG